MIFRKRDLQHRPVVLRIAGLSLVDGQPGAGSAILRDIDVDIRQGETVCLVGESGSGKSMTSLAVMGLLPKGHLRVTGGRIELDGQNLLDLGPAALRDLRAKRISMIFQEPMTALNPVMKVGPQIEEVLDSHTALPRREKKQRVLDIMEQVHLPDVARIYESYPHQLSGGQRQRIMIAMALVLEPRLLIADEPTTALDVSIQAQILDLLRKLCREKQVGMIIITHDMGVIADVTDRVAVLYRGKLVEQGPTAKILGNPDHPYTRSLISAVPRPDVKLRRFPVVTYIEDVKRPTVELDIATHWLGQRREFARRAAGPLVEVEDLGMRFVLRNAFLARNRRTLDAVKQVNLSINEGEVFGLVGESGSGKSTVARLIAGLYTPTNGRVLFNGVDLTGLKDEKRMNAFRRQIQMVFQDPYSSLNPRMRVQEIVAEPIRFHRLAEGEAQTRRVVADLLDVVGLGASAAQRYPHEFSGGQRQRICIARALALDPKVVIADESVSALDVSIQAQIVNLLIDLQRDLGIAFLFISHDMAVVERVSHRVAVMYLGQIVEIGPRRAIFENPQHPYTRKLMAAVPIADPARRHMSRTLLSDEIPSPIRQLNDEPVVAPLVAVGPDHFVARHSVGGAY